MFYGGSKSAKGGPNTLADMDRGGSKYASGFGPGVQIRCCTCIMSDVPDIVHLLLII